MKLNVRYFHDYIHISSPYIYTEYFIVTLAINYLAKGVRCCTAAFVNVKYVPGALV